MSESGSKPFPAPFLAGKLVSLKPQTEADMAVAVPRINDPEVRHYSRATFPVTLESRKKEIAEAGEISQKSDAIRFAIWLNAEERVIGDCGLSSISWTDRNCWVGLGIGDKSCWGKGIAVEAGTLLLDYAFGELNLHKVITGIFSPNVRSQGVAKKGKLACIGVLRDHVWVDGHFIDSCVYEMFHDDWIGLKDDRQHLLEAILPP